MKKITNPINSWFNTASLDILRERELETMRLDKTPEGLLVDCSVEKSESKRARLVQQKSYRSRVVFEFYPKPSADIVLKYTRREDRLRSWLKVLVGIIIVKSFF